MIEPPFLVSLNSPRNICANQPSKSSDFHSLPRPDLKNTNPALSAPRAPPPPYHSVRRNKEASSPPSASPPLLPAIAPPPGRPSGGRVAGFGAGPGPGPPMASPEQEAAVAAAIVEDVMRQQGGGCGGSGGGGDTVGSWRNLDIAWRKAEEAGESRCISFLGEKMHYFCEGNLHLLMVSTYSI